MVVLSFNDVKLEVECIINDRSRELNCMNFGVVTVGIKAVGYKPQVGVPQAITLKKEGEYNERISSNRV